MTNPIRTALERLLSDIQDLSDYSEGIVGLHRNGDPAPWNELLEGGRYSSWLGDAIAAARAALAEQQGEAIGPEWQPCVKLPITVHVREQRPSETHVSTREGITPVQPDDLIMRGVAGEEYPIGRELFNKTYRLLVEPTPPAELLADLTSGSKPLDPEMAEVLTPEARWDLYAGSRSQPPAEGEVAELVELLHKEAADDEIGDHMLWMTPADARRAAELLQQQQAKIESLEQQLETERMRVVACGIIATSDTPLSAAKDRNCHPDYWSASADDIARQIDELMRLRAQQTPVPVSEGLPEPEDCDAEGRCWYYTPVSSVLCAYWVLRQPDSLRTWETHRLPAHALPVPQGEVE